MSIRLAEFDQLSREFDELNHRRKQAEFAERVLVVPDRHRAILPNKGRLCAVPSKYDLETRAKAVRLVLDHRGRLPQ
jgi:hypothetical protein